MTVAKLRAWLRELGFTPPHMLYMSKERLVVWIEEHVITLSG